MIINKEINISRLESKIKEMGKIGVLQGGGVCRLALTDDDKKARDLLYSWMQDLGLDIIIDQIGNMFGIRPGLNEGTGLMIGSHLDTVSTGGLYDGSLGVLAGLEVLETLNENNIKTDKAIVLANFTNEEGVRFVPDMMGSLGFSKKYNINDLLDAKALDTTSVSVEQELERIGYKGTVECGTPHPDHYIELHIEQGPVLENESLNIGIVEKVQGIYWTEYIFDGLANHAGTTPMNMRNDAGFVASSIIPFVRELVLKTGKKQVGTVGLIEFYPNLINVTAEKARIITDLRNPDEKILKQVQDKLDEFISGLSQYEKVRFTRNELVRMSPVNFDPDLVRILENSAKNLNYTYKRMTSGAGHDAQLMSYVCPSAMIFVPSCKGISHNPKEFSYIEDIRKGVNILLDSAMVLTRV